jgi:hypothetical protein
MKNIQFNSIEEADLFVDTHANPTGDAMVKRKAIDNLMRNSGLHGIRECLNPSSPHYINDPSSRQFANEMQSIGVEAFIDKMMSVQRHYWDKRFKLRDFASKRIQCATTEIRTIEEGQAVATYQPLTYFDRTLYAVNSLAYKQLEQQKPLLIDWFIQTHKYNPGFNLGTPYRNAEDEYYEMADINIKDAIEILNNDYIVPHVYVKTTYLVPYQTMRTSNGDEVQSWKYGKVTDDWDSFSTSIEMSFSSIQSEISSKSHLYGETVYLWYGRQPCIN